MEGYLRYLEDHNILPNFWCAEEYFRRAQWKAIQTSQSIEVVDVEGNRMLPIILGGVIQGSHCWSTLLNESYIGPHWSFLDYNFIYDPFQFKDLSGSRWRDTRKNLNWAREDAKEGLITVAPQHLPPKRESEFWERVAEENKQELYDPEVMVDYMINGDNRLYIVGKDTNRIYGEVIWDYNNTYVNFRYCIVLKNHRGLSDLCRIEFYRNICKENKLVNDGGSLGREGLYKYKMRLNPIEVYKVFTWEEE